MHGHENKTHPNNKQIYIHKYLNSQKAFRDNNCYSPQFTTRKSFFCRFCCQTSFFVSTNTV